MMVKRVAGALGAELQAVNLGDGFDAELAGTLRALLNKHEVLFLRDQNIEPAAQKALAAIFGPLQTHPAYNTVEGLPEVMILESTPENPSKIEVWHSDMTFRQHPPSVTADRGRKSAMTGSTLTLPTGLLPHHVMGKHNPSTRR